MEPRRTWRQRLSSAYWWVVGMFGGTSPVVDRKQMYGDDPANDPYRTGFDPSRQPDADRDRSN